jgi:hypothetical protein
MCHGTAAVVDQGHGAGRPGPTAGAGQGSKAGVCDTNGSRGRLMGQEPGLVSSQDLGMGLRLLAK